ncbi:MAG: hypothetical protein OXC62_12785, partial [Aestuariivita sp.]|nr:hypothetical protein [Aestuariivita sp.]
PATTARLPSYLISPKTSTLKHNSRSSEKLNQVNAYASTPPAGGVTFQEARVHLYSGAVEVDNPGTHRSHSLSVSSSVPSDGLGKE